MLPLRLAQPLAARISNIIKLLIIFILHKSILFKFYQRHFDNYLTPFSPIPLSSDLIIEYIVQFMSNPSPPSIDECILSLQFYLFLY